MNGGDREIERKFLVDTLPEGWEASPRKAVRQGYLADGGPEGGATVRIREIGEAWRLTFKSGRGLSRREIEVPLSRDQFEPLWPATEGRRVEKVRHELPLSGGLVVELDLFGGALEGLVLAEVEFADEATARAFDPPGWMGRDVTDEPGWTNASLARNGRPDRS